MNVSFHYVMSIFLALLLHGGVIALMLMNWQPEPTMLPVDNKLYYIDVSTYRENPIKAKQKRTESNRRERVRARNKRLAGKAALRQAAIDRERLEIEALERQNAITIEDDSTNNIVKDSVAIERQSDALAAEIEKQLGRTEEARKLMEKDLDTAIIGEQQAIRAVTDDEKAKAYVGQIQQEIIQNWSRPPSARNGMQAVLRVFLVPTGDVVNVKVEESSGNDAFDRSAVLAVNKARSFIVPKNSRQFEANFRQFVVLFRPDDLRL